MKNTLKSGTAPVLRVLSVLVAALMLPILVSVPGTGPGALLAYGSSGPSGGSGLGASWDLADFNDGALQDFTLTVDKPLDESGSTQEIAISFGIAGAGGNEIEFGPGDLQVRVTLPAGVTPSFPSISDMKFEVGGRDSPSAPLGASGTYMWITWEKPGRGGVSDALVWFSVELSKNGVTDSGTQYTVTADAFYMGEQGVYTDSKPFTAIAKHFGWKSVTPGVRAETAPGTWEAVTASKGTIPLANEYDTDLPKLEITYSVPSNTTDRKTGLAFTKSVAITDEFEVMTENGKPVILFTESDIALLPHVSRGAVTVTGTWRDQGTGIDYVTRFEVKAIMDNGTLGGPDPTEIPLSPDKPGFTITGAKADADLAATTITMYIRSTKTQGDKIGVAEAAYLTGENGVYSYETQELVIDRQTWLQLPYAEIPNNADATRNNGVDKYLSYISGQPAFGSNATGPFTAPEGDKVTFTIQGFENKEKRDIHDMHLFDESFYFEKNGVYTHYMLPYEIITGTYEKKNGAGYVPMGNGDGTNADGKYEVVVNFFDGTSVSAEAYFAASGTINLFSDLGIAADDLKEIKSIDFHYGAVPPGFRPAAKPQVSFTMLDNSAYKDDPDNDPYEIIETGGVYGGNINNTAHLHFQYLSTDTVWYDAEDSASLSCADELPGLILKGKKAENLSRSDGKIGIGDILRFEIEIENEDPYLRTFDDIEIEDFYDNAYLVPYNVSPLPDGTIGTGVVTNLEVTGAGSTTGIDAGATGILTGQLKDRNGNLLWSDPPANTVPLEGDYLHIQLKGGLKPGETLTLTYTMQVVYNASLVGGELTNHYLAYAVNNTPGTPGHGGSGGGKWLVAKGNFEQFVTDVASLPSVSVVKSVVRATASDGVTPSDPLKLADGDIVRFSVKARNATPAEKVVTKKILVDNIVDQLPQGLIFPADAAGLDAAVTFTEAAGNPAHTPAVTGTVSGLNGIFALDQTYELLKGDELELQFNAVVDHGLLPGFLDGPAPKYQMIINTAGVFFHKGSEMNILSGKLEEDTANLDNDPDTEFYVASSAYVRLLRGENDVFSVRKEVYANPNLPVNDANPKSRTYRIYVYNYGTEPLVVTGLSDILPKFELPGGTYRVYDTNSTSIYKNLNAPDASSTRFVADSDGIPHALAVFTDLVDKNISKAAQPDRSLVIPGISGPGTAYNYRIIEYNATILNTLTDSPIRNADARSFLNLKQVFPQTANTTSDPTAGRTNPSYYPNTAAIYLKNAYTVPSDHIMPQGPDDGIVAQKDAGDWNKNGNTEEYRYVVKKEVTFTGTRIAPKILLTAQTVAEQGGKTLYQTYDKLNPVAIGSDVGWRVDFANIDRDTAVVNMADPYISVLLPPDMEYKSVQYTPDGSAGAETFLDFDGNGVTDEPTVTYSPDGSQQILTWHTKGLFARNTSKSFYIRTGTADGVAASYVAEAYIIPALTDTVYNQIFFDSEYTDTEKMTFVPVWIDRATLEDMPDDTYEERALATHAVRAVASVNVFGAVSAEACIFITELDRQGGRTGQTTNSFAPSRVITVPTFNDRFSYDLAVSNLSSNVFREDGTVEGGTNYEDLWIINRLPRPQDGSTINVNSKRSSEVGAELFGDDLVVAVYPLDKDFNVGGTPLRTLTRGTDYTLEYLFDDDVEFTDADWGKSAGAESDWRAGAAGRYGEVTAIRVKLLVPLTPATQLRVSYNAQFQYDRSDPGADIAGLTAQNSFGYAFRALAKGDYRFMRAEPRKVGVMPATPGDEKIEVTIHKAAEAGSEILPGDSFNVRLVGKDRNGVTRYDQLHAVTPGAPTVVSGLTKGLDYSFTEILTGADAIPTAGVYEFVRMEGGAPDADGNIGVTLYNSNEKIEVTIHKAAEAGSEILPGDSFNVRLVGRDRNGVTRYDRLHAVTPGAPTVVTGLTKGLDYSFTEILTGADAIPTAGVYEFVRMEGGVPDADGNIGVTFVNRLEEEKTVRIVLNKALDTQGNAAPDSSFYIRVTGRALGGAASYSEVVAIPVGADGRGRVEIDVPAGLSYSLEEIIGDEGPYALKGRYVVKETTTGGTELGRIEYTAENTLLREGEAAVTIYKILNQNSNNPRDTRFYFTLEAWKDGRLDHSEEHFIDVVRDGAVYRGSKTVTGLSADYEYRCTEVTGKLSGTYTLQTHSEADADNTVYAFYFTNTPRGGGGGDDRGGGGGGGDGSGIDYTTIVDLDVPLGGPELTTILDEDVPLGRLPKTGASAGKTMGIIGLLLGLGGIAFGTKSKGDGEDKEI